MKLVPMVKHTQWARATSDLRLHDLNTQSSRRLIIPLPDKTQHSQAGEIRT